MNRRARATPERVHLHVRFTFNTYAAHGSINIPVNPNNSLHPKNPLQVEHVGNYAHLHRVPIESRMEAIALTPSTLIAAI